MFPENDIELAVTRDGYPALADWMARDPDGETFIFRRFDSLAARNLLHLQAEIFAMKRNITELDSAARLQDSTYGAWLSSMRWETLMEHSKDENRPEYRRVEMMKRLRVLMRDYCRYSALAGREPHLTDIDEALLQRSELSKLQRPSGRSLAAALAYVKGVVSDDKWERVSQLIGGDAQTFLDDEFDLVALSDPPAEDYLSQIFHAYWPFRRYKADDPFDRTMIYKNSHIVRTVSVMSLMLAAVLLIGAIVHLYLISDPAAKLGFVTMYTLLFATSIYICTNARRVEVFAATAAYAAVLVVFVSGDLGGSKTEQCLIHLESGMFRLVRCPD